MSDMDKQSEIKALQTLVSRGVLSQEQFNQLRASILESPSSKTPSLPPPSQLKKSGRKKTLILSTVAALVLGACVGLLLKQQQDSQRREAEKLEQVAQEKKDQAAKLEQEAQEAKEQEKQALREANQRACADKSELSNAWAEYVGLLNKNNDASQASSLMQAKRWSLSRGDATSAFRRVLKQIDHPEVTPYRDDLLRQVNLLEDGFTLMGGADTWSQYNSLITSTNLLGNDLNEFKDDLFDAIIKACNGNSD